MLMAVVITSCAVACFSLSVTALSCALQNARRASFFLFRGRRHFPRREYPYAQNKQTFYFLSNRNFLIRFGSLSCEFGGRGMVRILAGRSRAKIPIARPKEPHMLPEHIKKVRLGI